MKEEMIKKFGDMLTNFCGALNSFCKEFSEVTGAPAPEVSEEDKLEVTEEVPTPEPVDNTPPSEDTPPTEDFAEDEEVAEVKEEEVNKDLDSIKEAVDDVAESDVEESAENLKKTFSKLLEARDKLFESATRKNFSEVKDCCDKLFSAAEDAKTYTARRKAKRLFDCIKFFADTVEEVLAETEETPAPAPAPTAELPADPDPAPVPTNFEKCPKCGKDPCECPPEDETTKEDFGDEFESAELDEEVEKFADKVPEDDTDLADFCGNLMNFACIAKSKEDADRKIRLLKAFSAAMDAPVAETDAAKQDEVDPEVAEEMKKTEEAEAKVTDVKLVEFSKLLRQSTGISKEVLKSFSSLMTKFAEEEAEKDKPKEETPPAEDKPGEEKPAEETPPPAEETKKEEEETPPAEDTPPAPTEDDDSDDDNDEEVVIDKTEVANFSQSSGDAYGDYMKKMLLR